VSARVGTRTHPAVRRHDPPPPLPAGRKVLVAGATGHLGQHVVRVLKERGYWVRALTRRPGGGALLPEADEVRHGDLLQPATLPSACAGVDAVFSCAGASLDVRRLSDRRSFTDVDYAGNRALLDAALRAGVPRFAYVSLFGGPTLERTEYARAHERFARALRDSGCTATVIRPTGFFHTFDEVLRMAQAGRGIVVGSGAARTNPIHEADLAEACIDALVQAWPELDVGGPETLTRAEIVDRAFAAVTPTGVTPAARAPKLTHVSPRLLEAAATLVRPLNPRLSALLAFGAAVSVTDAVAPSFGSRRIESYFRALAAPVAAPQIAPLAEA